MLLAASPTKEQSSRSVCSFVLLAICLFATSISSTAQAQTPWESAPALPSQVPKTSPNIRVASLPPPPPASLRPLQRRSDAPSLYREIDSPGHVPIPKTNSTSQAASSLIPDAFSLPNEVQGNALQAPTQSGQKAYPVANRNANPNLPALPDLSQLPLPTGLSQNTNQTSANPGGSSPKRASSLPLGYPQLPSYQSNPAQQSNSGGNVGGQSNSFRSGTGQSSPPSGSLVAYESQPTASPANAPRSSAQSESFDAGELVAVVGSDHILAGDMAIFVEPIIEKNRDKISGKAQEDQIRSQLTRQVLKEYVVIKAMHQEFFRDVLGSGPPDEAEKTRKLVSTKASKMFYEKRVPDLLKQYKVQGSDLAALETKLREKSISLRLLRIQFVEQVLAGELERKYVPAELQVDRRELLDYYQKNRTDWAEPAKARWRQLTIRFDKHANNRKEVESLINGLGNQLINGQPFQAAARQHSEGYTAEDGGVYDWTTQGSLKSKPLDAALFSLPLGKLSQVIEDDIGMHIIEVLERKNSRTKEFTEAQVEIRKTLSQEKRALEVKKLHQKVLARTPIWSKWPEDLKEKAKHVRPLSDAIGDE